MARFKKEILKIIKSDPDLFAVVAKEMDVKPVSLPQIIERNGNSVNQFGVVQAVAKYLNVDMESLVESEDTEKMEVQS